MIVSVPKEPGSEHRVSLVPLDLRKLAKAGLNVRVESGAGKESFFTDEQYRKEGADVISGSESLYKDSDILFRVNVTDESEVDKLKENSVLIGLLNPFLNGKLIARLAEKKITSFAMELIPRISRAQGMDALSSQASISGYKAVLLAANKLGKIFPMMTTAAGTITPAKVLVIGVGVAGLQAIATAKRLGAVVEAFDIRPQTKQEVESLGAKFIEIKLGEEAEAGGGYAKEVSEDAKKKEHEVLTQHIRQSDVVITAAAVPGRKAPVLVTEEMLTGMKEGSIIVDLAAETGGNCSLTQPKKDIDHNGITIMGPVNLPSAVPVHASQMYSRNISTFLMNMVKEGKINIDLTDDITKSCLVTQEGKIVHEAVAKVIG
jgi:proton-translocating NAD(P)+ transhydrogenase subunit alpha